VRFRSVIWETKRLGWSKNDLTSEVCKKSFIFVIILTRWNRNAGHSGRAVWGVGLGRLVAGIVGSNPAQGMDVCPHLSVLCCPE
jgi:hypothetical protein